MSTITKGDGRLGTIYERLRKRSYRQVSKGRFFFYHRGYVDGVKDALNAVAEDERKVG